MLLSGLKSCSVLATFRADSKSTAAAKSKPRNWLGVSPSHTLRLAALRHDLIMAKTYYGKRENASPGMRRHGSCRSGTQAAPTAVEQVNSSCRTRRPADRP